ncbi:MAG: polysaccharide deacetylase family protein [Albidovulum sp.]
MATPAVDILMYHSVSDRGGATSIHPRVFAGQMRAISEAGVDVISLDDYLAAKAGQKTLAKRSVVVTFDDGFQDFAEVAWPEMRSHGFLPIVYLPTGFVGGAEGWRGIATPPRPLMGWDTARALAGQGVEFGSHTVTHPDLNGLTDSDLDAELTQSRALIEARLGCPVRHFAPPYGIARPKIRARISKVYATSVGTRLGSASLRSDAHDLPRIEMYYFTDLNRWRAQLDGRGGAYLATRQAMRGIKTAVMKPWRGV